MEGLDTLLSMHGTVVYRDDGYWWKIEAWTVPPTIVAIEGKSHESQNRHYV